MDASAFDRAVRAFATGRTRRHLLGLLGMLPLQGWLTTHPEEPAEAAGRRHRRKKHHHHQQGDDKDHRKGQQKGKDKGNHHPDPVVPPSPPPPTCVPQPQTATCAGTCATVRNNCGDPVDCGSCACSPGCPLCQTCDEGTGQCVAVANATPCDDGLACTTGDTCQGGTCTGTPVSCTTPPVCRTAVGASCNASTGQCDYPIVLDGVSCGGGHVCCDTTPTCRNQTCVACSAHSDCPADHLCLADGSCQACDVTCPSGSSPSECGIALQAAINAGGTQYVCPGRYRGSTTDSAGFLFEGTVRVVGAGDGDDPTANTVFDQDADNCRVLTNHGGHTELSNVRVTGGRLTGFATIGAGVYNHSGDITMTHCTVDANIAASQGGGLVNGEFQSMTLIGCTISANKSTAGGAGMYNFGTLILDGCDVLENETEESGSGGGIYSLGGELTLRNGTTVRSNRAKGYGGGLYCEDVSSVIIDDCSITHNDSAKGGGGINVGANAGSTSLTLRNSEVSENTADTGAGIYFIAGRPGEMTIDNSSVTVNTATSIAGGIFVLVSITSPVKINDSLVQRNRAGGFAGGIYSAGPSAVVKLEGTTSVTDNINGNCTGDVYEGRDEHCGP